MDTVDVQAAATFAATHARVLDRRRLGLLLGGNDRVAVIQAVDAYRNSDGGYAWGLEPDLRSVESQPAAALHAFEAMADAAPLASRRAVALCDWLLSVTLPDGGLPFALPVGDPAGCSPFWVDADPTASSLQITAIVVARAYRVAAFDAAVAGHRWLARATDFCLDAARRLGDEPHAYELEFALTALDVLADERPEARALMTSLARHLPADGVVPVAGGVDGEVLRPLDFAPEPGRPVREFFAEDVIAADLQRLASQQQTDGGWPVEWATSSPAAAMEWRGYLTVRALTILRDNGMLEVG